MSFYDDDPFDVGPGLSAALGVARGTPLQRAITPGINPATDLPYPRDLRHESMHVATARLARLKAELGTLENDLARGQVCSLLAEQLLGRASSLARTDPDRARLLADEAAVLVDESAALIRLRLQLKTVSVEASHEPAPPEPTEAAEPPARGGSALDDVLDATARKLRRKATR